MDEMFEVEPVGSFGKDLRLKATFTCPECKRKTIVTPQMEAQGQFRCPCGLKVEVQGDGLRSTQKATDELNRTIQNLFKGFGK